jgi:carbamoyl-phosphate synthase small subunit
MYVPNPAGDVRIAVPAKANILRALVQRGAVVTVLPWDYYVFNAIRNRLNGLLLSNGPGDPQQC